MCVCVCVCVCVCIHSPADGHLGCLHLLAIVNNAALDMVVECKLDFLLSDIFQIYAEEELLDHQ